MGCCRKRGKQRSLRLQREERGEGMSDVAKEYAAGLAAGVATVVTGHPFDTVKVDSFLFFLLLLVLNPAVFVNGAFFCFFFIWFGLH